MSNLNLWKAGDHILLRGVYNGSATYMQSARVVQDTPEETALLVWPGAECMVPSGYLHHAHDRSMWDRWAETTTNTLKLEKYIWHTNRFLILLEPEKYFSTIYIWEAAKDKFVGYYINFQLPYRRSRLGFDTLDLDLDIVIEPDFQWSWKDMDEYQQGIEAGGIHADWVNEVERAKQEVFTRLEKRGHPFNSDWLNWRPNPNWAAPNLPENWDVID